AFPSTSHAMGPVPSVPGRKRSDNCCTAVSRMPRAPRPDLPRQMQPRKCPAEKPKPSRPSWLLSPVMVLHVPHGFRGAFAARMHALRVVFRRGGVQLPAMFVAFGLFSPETELFFVRVGDAHGLTDLLDHILVGRRIAPRRGLLAALLGCLFFTRNRFFQRLIPQLPPVVNVFE